MKTLWLAAVIVALVGCSSMEYDGAYRDRRGAYNNPALLNCPSGKVPVCDIQGGRTSKYYYNCSCR